MEEKKNDPPVVVKDVHKAFGKQKVLDGIDMTVHGGEIVVVLGRSGTGKSVLLKLLIGLQRADSGSISIHGREIAELDRDELNDVRKKVGFLFQQAALYDSLNVEENVEFPLKRHTKLSSEERKNRVRELLESVEMEEHVGKMPSELSGGMQKRVAVARALALNPDVLLFDEPTAGLDPITGAEIGKLISRLRQESNRTSIVVTHDIHGAKAFADRLVMVHEGRILIDGTFDDLRKSEDPFVVRFVGEAT